MLSPAHGPQKKVLVIINNNSNECVRYGVNKRRLRLTTAPEGHSGGGQFLFAGRVACFSECGGVRACAIFFLQYGTTRVLGGYACAE